MNEVKYNNMFPLGWQMLTFPDNCGEIYKDYMNRKKIQYEEVMSKNKLKALVFSRKYRPHSWKLEFPL